jgi:putative spermidine/putrescine transport system permease protein
MSRLDDAGSGPEAGPTPPSGQRYDPPAVGRQIRYDMLSDIDTTGSSRSGSTGRPPRRISTAWLGLVPFFVYITVFFLLPTAAIVYNAFRVTDPDTQVSSFTTKNVTTALGGVYRTSILNSIELSVISAVLGAVFGLFLAWAIVTSRGPLLPRWTATVAAVFANFGGVPLAFLFVFTIGNSGVVTLLLEKNFGIGLQSDLGFSLYSLTGLVIVYLYFQIPLMVLVITPALQGLRPQWQEAAANLGASRWQYWRYIGGPVLAPNFLGSVLLLFCTSFSAFATANALIGGSFPIIPIQIFSIFDGNVLAGQENLGAALSLIMIVVVVPLTIFYQLLQRRTTRWLR